MPEGGHEVDVRRQAVATWWVAALTALWFVAELALSGCFFWQARRLDADVVRLVRREHRFFTRQEDVVLLAAIGLSLVASTCIAVIAARRGSFGTAVVYGLLAVVFLLPALYVLWTFFAPIRT